MRSILLLSACLAAAAPDDAAMAKYGLAPADVRDALFINVTSGDFWTPSAPPSLIALDGAERAAAVKLLGQFAKAYVASSDFQTRYAKWRTHEFGEAPKKPPTYDEFIKSQKQQAAATQKQVKEQTKAMPPEQQEMLKQMQAQMKSAAQAMTPEQKAQIEQMMGQAPQGEGTASDAKLDRDVYEQTVVAKYKQDQAAYQEHLSHCPEKSTAAVKAALTHFLAATADVAFDAKVVEVSGRRVFADDALEGKPDIWKRSFRAGKEATAAARQFAQAWASELK